MTYLLIHLSFIIPAYIVGREVHKSEEKKWTMGDRIMEIPFAVLFSWVMFIIGVYLWFTRNIDKNKPAKW